MKNKLIIDSGATKTEYALVEGNNILFSYKNKGINANYVSDEDFLSIINEFVEQKKIFSKNDVHEIIYYGAGCANEKQAIRVKRLLKFVFNISKITVYSDLLAVCHALYENNSGYVAILGTGSSVAFYDGKNTINKMPSLGYLLGDEGSGIHIGKLFLTKYLSDELSDKIVADFENYFSTDKTLTLNFIYQNVNPNIYMSSIAPFLSKNINNNEIVEICKNSFAKLFKKIENYYKKDVKNINISGSIAFHFQKIIKEVASDYNIIINQIIANPIILLIKYHSKC